MIETERKYVIREISDEKLKRFENFEKIEILQTYLKCDLGLTERVRKCVFSDGKIEYVFNRKKRISPISCIEDENKITKEEYSALLNEKEAQTESVEKTRRRFFYKGQMFEIDSYPFSKEFCICETELESENENTRAEFPKDIEIIKEVSGDKRFSNHFIAKALFGKENIFDGFDNVNDKF